MAKVYYLKIDQLLPGMISAESIYTDSGEEIVAMQTVLSSKHIVRIKMYCPLKELPVIVPSTLSDVVSKEDFSHLNKIRNSMEFKRFRKEYMRATEVLKTTFQGILDKKAQAFHQEELVSMVCNLTKESYSVTHIFDLLHCMRDFTDSVYVHSLNVALISNSLGKWLQLSEPELYGLTLSGVLHDIGKLLIPPGIISKPTALTEYEFAMVKEHPKLGYNALGDLELDSQVLEVALMHHERNDGSGYPYHLLGEAITPFAKIVAIADVYDAMTALRTYRDSISPFDVVGALEQDGYQKYEAQYLLVFLERIAQAYIGVPVLLTNSLVGEVVMINKQKLSQPVIKVGNEFLDLSKEQSIKVKALI